MKEKLHIVGGGLAGSEAAWAAANMGVPVVLHEMRPVRGTAAHKTEGLAELVCSNSFRSDDATSNAVGVLHAEMRLAGSLVMAKGDANQVPAGGALAVDRDGFSAAVTAALEAHPLIEIVREEVTGLPPAEWAQVDRRHRAADRAFAGRGDRARRPEQESLSFFDAIAPIVHFDIDRPGHGLVPVALRQGRSRRHRQGLHQLPDGQGAVRGLRRCAARRREDRASRSGKTSLFRRLPADRGDGRARTRDAAPRPDEADGPHQCAQSDRQGLCRRAAAPGQCAGHALQHGRLPDQAEAWRAGANLPHDSRARECRVRPARRPAPQHLHQFAEAARRNAAAEVAARPALCRPDHRLRGLCRRAPRSDCWPGRFAAARDARSALSAAAGNLGYRRAAPPHHQRAMFPTTTTRPAIPAARSSR